MYRRYSNANDPGMTLDQRKRSRLKDIIIIVLVIALAALAVISYPALQSRNGSHDLYVLRMRSECDEAIRLTNTLSRNAGADSAGILARIRSNIYAMTVINVFNNNQEVGNGDLVPTTTLETILNTPALQKEDPEFDAWCDRVIAAQEEAAAKVLRGADIR